MMYGIGETMEQRVIHMRRIRELQEETGGFTAFIPWPYQIHRGRIVERENTAVDYLRTLAVARIYLENIPHIQASWVTQGLGIAQLALFFGADDFGSTMIEENVVRSVGVIHRTTRGEIVRNIHQAGFDAVKRTHRYRDLEIIAVDRNEKPT
ncbi:MAG: hypothetical protein MZW92_71880 [Comamonadaceae bacterium]|nr:hypothetical protein [Comamonadaceae bacterium]